MNMEAQRNTAISRDQATTIAEDHFGITGRLEPLVGWANQNFRVDAIDGRQYVLKISPAGEHDANLDAQNAALAWLHEKTPELTCPRVVRTQNGAHIARWSFGDEQHTARLLTHVPGVPLAQVAQRSNKLLESVGAFLGELDVALEDFVHPGASRNHLWDLDVALDVIANHVGSIPSPADRQLIERSVSRVRDDFLAHTRRVRRSVIHNDANDHNLLVDVDGPDVVFVGIIDFGDLVETCTVFEVAIAATYGMLGQDDPFAAAASVLHGYHLTNPLGATEVAAIFPAIVLRLSVSVCLSAHGAKQTPNNPYLTVSETQAWNLLRYAESVSPHAAAETFRNACEIGAVASKKTPTSEVASRRATHLGPNLSIAYQEPLQIARGSMQYLYDEQGREFLDTVNNVCHVGHCHPRVVRAAHAQMAQLNTNTRYLHERLGEYAARLCATLPPALDVCYFVCSGSEANELALRLARAHTGNHHVVVVNGAYHGNTTTLIDLSPYKHRGRGGMGTPSYVQVATSPDIFRGPYRDEKSAGRLYGNDVATCVAAIESEGARPAAFFCESLPSCAGQIVLPQGYLQHAYAAVRGAGGVCVADEVQVGFGRVGSTFWGFESQGVVPDIVTMGKPMGNGHPIAAVVTTARIAESFNDGMEYFNTFGGNPVSCVVGLAVLDVIRDEHLQENANAVGAHFRHELWSLYKKHELIGDVRGEGLFLGVELVRSRATQEPATSEAKDVVEKMKSRGILVSTDGPFDNVLKIKPPLCFTKTNADRYVDELDELLNVELRTSNAER